MAYGLGTKRRERAGIYILDKRGFAVNAAVSANGYEREK